VIRIKLAVIIFLLLSLPCHLAAQHYTTLPPGSKKVEISVHIFNMLRTGNPDSVRTLYPQAKKWLKKNSRWIDTLNVTLQYFEKCIPADTVYSESLILNPGTEISFKVSCNAISPNLNYWLKTVHFTNEAGLDDYKFWIERDRSRDVVRQE